MLKTKIEKMVDAMDDTSAAVEEINVNGKEVKERIAEMEDNMNIRIAVMEDNINIRMAVMEDNTNDNIKEVRERMAVVEDNMNEMKSSIEVMKELLVQLVDQNNGEKSIGK